MSTLEKILV